MGTPPIFSSLKNLLDSFNIISYKNSNERGKNVSFLQKSIALYIQSFNFFKTKNGDTHLFIAVLPVNYLNCPPNVPKNPTFKGIIFRCQNYPSN